MPENPSRIGLGEARVSPRTAVVASADRSFRERVSEALTGLRWRVREAEGGAQAWAEADASTPQAMIVDDWLPDLDLNEFLLEFGASFPEVELMHADGTLHGACRGRHRQELLHALRSSQDTDTAAWNTAPMLKPQQHAIMDSIAPMAGAGKTPREEQVEPLPGMVGRAGCMIEVSRRVRLVAPRPVPVLIEGPTGSGKELVARAVHLLSGRSHKPFVAINCAAIPEALLEAELFGHTRGAFTGAVKGRRGRIEAADGGTLFLDEVGEMPLSVQAKLLRFVESGELQKVGDNAAARVDVRLLAATHQPLAAQAQAGTFRADLYYRLAVFLIRTPALTEHLEDLPALVDYFLNMMGREMPIKSIDTEALSKLQGHNWPGHVRELKHVLERAAILAGDAQQITVQEIDFCSLVH